MSRDLVYSSVFGNYDWVFPPCEVEAEMDYVLVTDTDGPSPRGWRRHVVDPARWGGARPANRYWKMLGYRELSSGHDRVLYVDANIRLLGGIRSFLNEALPNGAAMGLFRHPLRDTVRDEVAAVLAASKVTDEATLAAEMARYKDAAFADDVGLSENTIMARRPDAPMLDEAMDMWWELYQKAAGRDQLSLPYVRWKTGIAIHWIEWSFREPNSHFAIYGHRGQKDLNPKFTWLEGRAPEGAPYDSLLYVWRGVRAMKRALRSKGRGLS